MPDVEELRSCSTDPVSVQFESSPSRTSRVEVFSEPKVPGQSGVMAKSVSVHIYGLHSSKY